VIQGNGNTWVDRIYITVATDISQVHNRLVFFLTLMRHEHSHNHDVAQETSRVPYLFLDDRLITDDRSGSSPSSNTRGNGSTTDTLQCSYCTRLLTEQCTVYTHDCWRLTGWLDGWMAGGRAGAQGRGRGKGVVGSYDKRGGLGALIRQRHVFGLDLR